MHSPPEISSGWIVLRLRLDPAVLDFRRAETQPAGAPCRMNTKSRIHISLRKSVVAWIEAEMEFALSQAVASGDAFEHGTSECGHCVQNLLTDLNLRDLPGEAARFELGADHALPTADLRFYPSALVYPVATCQAMQRQYGELVPIGEASSGLDGPVERATGAG